MNQLGAQQDTQHSEHLMLADVLGYDMASSEKEQMEYTTSNDVMHLSCGGIPVVGPGTNFEIRLMEEGSVHDLLAYAITFNVTIPTTNGNACHWAFTNALQLFEGIALKIGEWQASFSRHDVYQQAYLLGLPKVAVESWAYGMGLDVKEYDELWDGSARVSNATGLGYGLLKQQHLYQNVLRTNSQRVITNAVNEALNASGCEGDSCFTVPLWAIFPEILTLDEQIYTGQGQTIEFSIRTEQQQKCLFNYEGTAVNGTTPSYSLTNISLIRQFANLNPQMNDMIKRSELVLSPLQNIEFTVSPISEEINLNFAISRSAKMRSLIFCFAPTTPGEGDGSEANLSKLHMQSWDQIANDENAFWSPLELMVALPVAEIEIDSAGSRTAHNTLGVFDPYHGGSLVSGLEHALKCVYRINLDRFPVDDIGSTAEGMVEVLAKIQLQTSDNGINTLLSTGSFATSFAQIAQKLTCYSFIEYQTPVDLDHGIYK